MNPLLGATHIVADVPAATQRFAQWLDYVLVEEGNVPADLAAAWDAPASAGRRYAILRPASGADVFLRFIEGDVVPDYRPIRTYGWAALEICIEDVKAVHQRMLGSPFEIIGPPSEIAGLPTIHPMQVRGPDQETVYLTQILTVDPADGLPIVQSFIDKLFIIVLASPDMRGTAQWFADVLGFQNDPPLAIPYRMISLAFDLPLSQRHEITTAQWDGNFVFEVDQYPTDATERPCNAGTLPPGVSICSIVHPDIDGLDLEWLSPPVVRHGVQYAGRRTGVVRTPEGALLEIIAAG